MSTRIVGEGASRALNDLAREQMKLRLLADIRQDILVCEIEGWPVRGFLRDLHEMIAHFDPCKEKA